MKKFLNEFREFAMRGNMLDMAIGVIIGSAFGKITTSLVNDVFMPLVGLLIGGALLSIPDIDARLGNSGKFAAIQPVYCIRS